MVEIGDKVFVTPVNGQKDYIAVITGPGGAGAVLNEGNYNTWTLEWSWSGPADNFSLSYSVISIDDRNNIFYFWWYSSSYSKNRFGSYHLADHSTIFESPTTSSYTYATPHISGEGDNLFYPGCHRNLSCIACSIQTYRLLTRYTYHTIEVWRAGAKIWSRDIRDDTGEASAAAIGTEISPTGKYIMFWENTSSELLLYKGSYVE